MSTSGGTPTGAIASASYNVTPATMAPIRNALALSGTKLVPHIVVADSLSSGYEQTGSETPATAWPGVFRTYLGNQEGFPDGGSLVMASDALFWPQWTYPAAFQDFGSFYGSTAAGTAAYLSTDQGTTPLLAYIDAGVIGWNYNIDGGANVPVANGNTGVTKLITGGAVGLGVHTINWVAAGAGVYPVAAGLVKANGVVHINMGLTASGVVASYNGTFPTMGAWSSSGANTLGNLRFGMVNLLTGGSWGKPVICFCVSSNDVAVGGYTPAQIIAAWTTMLGLITIPYAGYVVTQYRQPTVTDATWNAWITALEAFAAAHSFPVFDWNARVGGYSSLLAAGMLQGDNIHPAAAASQGIGQAVASALVSI